MEFSSPRTESKSVKTHQPCPQCSSSDGYTEYSDGHGFCFANCGYIAPSGDKAITELDFSYQYLSRRGISEETHRFYNAKTKVDSLGVPISVGYHYPNGSYKIRSLGRKSFLSEGDITKAGLFGSNLFAAGASRYVTITEGEDDALALHEVLGGNAPVVSVQSSSSAVRDCTVAYEWLNSFERIYLAFDSDTPGRNALQKVARLFDYNKVYHVKFSNRKDATEFVEHGERQQLKNIWWNSKKYLPEEIVSSFADFKDILSKPDPVGIPYPWHTLTSMTYGIRTGESVLITAQEGIGKTEVMHAIEHHLLKTTSDPIGAIFLEEAKKRHLQAVAGLEIKKPIRLPEYKISDAETLGIIQRVVGTDERLHIYSHFGSDDPEVILDTIRFLVSARGCRYILLDHLSMVVSGLAGEEERRALDYLVTRLEMMVQELDFALIFVSHVNDAGQTRGSRYIGKICHQRIDLERDVNAALEEDRFKTKLYLSKNRFGMKTGPAGVLIFNPTTGTYTEELGFASPLTEPANANNINGYSLQSGT